MGHEYQNDFLPHLYFTPIIPLPSGTPSIYPYLYSRFICLFLFRDRHDPDNRVLPEILYKNNIIQDLNTRTFNRIAYI